MQTLSVLSKFIKMEITEKQLLHEYDSIPMNSPEQAEYLQAHLVSVEILCAAFVITHMELRIGLFKDLDNLDFCLTDRKIGYIYYWIMVNFFLELDEVSLPGLSRTVSASEDEFSSSFDTMKRRSKLKLDEIKDYLGEFAPDCDSYFYQIRPVWKKFFKNTSEVESGNDLTPKKSNPEMFEA